MPSIAEKELYLGYTPDELERSAYARFFRPQMAPLAGHVREALLTGAIAHELMPPVSRAGDLHHPGYWAAETGYSTCLDGSARVFVLTPMPGVTPAMWDWWFAWHGSEAQRYKLWHPRAHVHVGWADGEGDLGRYVGRISNVVEFVGPARMNLTIRFVRPSEAGLDEKRLVASGEVAICARGGIAGTPMETGWLIHHVRPVEGGSEMRSRFWVGGENVRPRSMPGAVGGVIGSIASRLVPLKAIQASELLVHCAQEMAHLAAFLPEFYATFGPAHQQENRE